jgi:hypothetical protein
MDARAFGSFVVAEHARYATLLREAGVKKE